MERERERESETDAFVTREISILKKKLIEKRRIFMYNEKTRIRFSHELFKLSSFVLFVRTSNVILILFTKVLSR